ncbi:peptide-methionine (S)-S-oxide reductase [Algoriphagus ratkowskyi]|uniref:peptide-methionine (S)-S-oxide reductase n=1 Tax=Algoriphagus ratkowskyi TaxID=57028 RepID=A0A2W7RFR6_9BACT|nr:peptide-methionine (S)-S-oxide reductase [Algoriphagus ratkowskyi]PZX59274.1 peptide-methionine (S)-S-oxide reductase [Algoriphagus ratkowskyi]TXD77452.1 peptide methionine sulfoxide reductase [Algoriphagus ratkowskyi]
MKIPSSENATDSLLNNYNSNVIGLGGGCHWCTEAIFQSLTGVVKVAQGWIASGGVNSSFSEAVLVTFDPEVISLETLLEIHLLTHSSTSTHSLRGKYRSAIYYQNLAQKKPMEVILENLRQTDKYITKILALKSFKLNEEKFLNYYQSRPDAPFCKTYISPKLSFLRKQFTSVVKSSDPCNVQ